MIFNKETVPQAHPSRLKPTIKFRGSSINFSFKAVEVLGASKSKHLNVQFDYREGKFYAIIGQTKESFVASIDKQGCRFTNQNLCRQIFKTFNTEYHKKSSLHFRIETDSPNKLQNGLIEYELTKVE